MKTFNTQSIRFAIAAIIAASTINTAFADCGGASVKEVKTAYSQAQASEAKGQYEAALAGYVHAQEYTCEPNPVEADAARRAAALALTLANAAEKRGEWDDAFRFYDSGGHYAKADNALIMHLRASPDDPGAFERARSHFENRALPAFEENNTVRLKTTGAYQVNPKHVADVLAMPAKGVERALQQEAAAFNETYLRETVQTIQARPEPTDMAAVQRAMPAMQAHAQKWPNDLLKESRAKLQTLRQWGSVTRDEALAKSVEKSFAQRIEQHVEALAQRYNGAPRFIEDAIDYQQLLNRDSAQSEPRIAKIKAIAMKLGDEASAKQRFILASEYYDAAGDDAKSQAAREQSRNIGMAMMQPSIDEMKRQADQLRAQYSDPAKVKAMQEQARAMQATIKQDQAAAKQANKKSAAELEKELGL